MNAFNILFFKFNSIRNKKWILSLRKGPTGIGYTFESLLGKQEDSLPYPDYYGIEIKTMRVNSRQKIHLFNANPDGDGAYPIDNIKSKIGYPDKTNPNYKIFNFTFTGDKYRSIGHYKLGKIVVDWKNEKLRFIVRHINGEEIPLTISWSFNLLREKLKIKMKKLAVVKAYSKIENSNEYFYYRWIEFYVIKDFDDFIRLIEQGIISITFQINVYKDGPLKGKVNNHGTAFTLLYKDIEMLYNKINIFEKR